MGSTVRSCAQASLTATYSISVYPAGKDRTNINTIASCPSPAASDTAVSMVPGGEYDFTTNCDAVVTLTAPAGASYLSTQCYDFTVYGNNNDLFMKSALILMVGTLFLYL